MATILLRTQHKDIATYGLDKDKVVKIGRLTENDIVIDNIAVSGNHAQIYSDEMGFIIKDMGSVNGTIIGGKPIKSRRLTDGDVITIGRHELVFSNQGMTSQIDLNASIIQPQIQSTEDRSTGFLDTRNQKDMLYNNSRLGNKVPLLVVKYNSKMVYKYLFKHKTTGIGRNQDNRVIIDNTAVSSQHAVITWDENGFNISDSGSKNGTFINGNMIKTCQLHDGDIITIGRHELVFEQEGSYTLDEISQSAFDDSPPMSSSPETSFLNTRQHQEMIRKSQEQGISSNVGPLPGLTFLNEDNKFLAITQKIIRIGKNKSCDIHVKGLMVGDTAAMILSKPDGFYLSYHKGLAKPSVNGKSVKDSVKLQKNDIIEIGSVKMEFTT